MDEKLKNDKRLKKKNVGKFHQNFKIKNQKWREIKIKTAGKFNKRSKIVVFVSDSDKGNQRARKTLWQAFFLQKKTLHCALALFATDFSLWFADDRRISQPSRGTHTEAENLPADVSVPVRERHIFGTFGRAAQQRPPAASRRHWRHWGDGWQSSGR